MNDVTVLVVDDDKEIVKAICLLLNKEGFHTEKAYDGIQAVEVLQRTQVHLILLDIMMPNQDGLTTTMKIRNEKNIPIILLSAKSEESDVILGLSMGADDYITKPYSPPELLARVKSQTRRYMMLGNYGKAADSKDHIRNGGLELVPEEKQLYVDGEPVKLTAKEYKITEFLMENAGRVYSAEQIYEQVWQEDAYRVENTVMVHIRNIREKIEINPGEPKYLKVVWGIGYKMEKYN